MAGTMAKADVVADLKASLLDAAAVFVAAADADFERHLAAAALDLGRKRGRTLVASLTLTANQAAYSPLPPDFLRYQSHLWGISPVAARAPWEKGYPGRLPIARAVEADGAQALYLDPAPSAEQIAMLGAEFRYYYSAGHKVDADGARTTVRASDRQMLLLRAQAEAMRELAMRNVAKPVQMREAMASTLKNGTASYLYEMLMQEFDRI